MVYRTGYTKKKKFTCLTMLSGGHRTLLGSPSCASTRPTSKNSPTRSIIPLPIQTRSSLSGIREDEISQTWVPQSHRQRPYLCYLAAQEPEEEGHTLEMVERGDISPVPATNVVTLSWEEQRLAKDSIIQEVAWVHNATLIIKETDRSGNDRSVILFDLSHRPDRMGMIVRSLGKNGELSDSGCIDMVRRDLGMTKVKQCRPFHSHNISIVFRNR